MVWEGMYLVFKLIAAYFEYEFPCEVLKLYCIYTLLP